MTSRTARLISEDFKPVQSISRPSEVYAVAEFSADLEVIAVLVSEGGELPGDLDPDSLAAAGFTGAAGSSIVLAREDRPVVLVGVGEAATLTVDDLRDAAALAARTTAGHHRRVGLALAVDVLPADRAGYALTEGALLARYRYRTLKADTKQLPLDRLELRVRGADPAELVRGIAEGLIGAWAGIVARDLANTPPRHLTAADLADVAIELGAEYGFDVEVLGRDQLVELGCGGILGVNAGSVEEPRLIVLRYLPDRTPQRHLGLVGKGIMFDSGGISLKPSDAMHLLMKIDMGGAAAVLGAFTALRDLGTESAVTGWLCCTDNMPSGSALKLGDVLTARNGTTVEVKNTDAEGRLVMMDGLALATEAGVDAVVDIATLTGAAMQALGKSRAAILGNDAGMLDRVRAAAEATDEPVWELPLEKKYRKQLDSDIADLSNLGGPFAGATTAALFLAEFVDGTPWAHIDIAGPMAVEADDSWRSVGATGFGARLLARLAADF